MADTSTPNRAARRCRTKATRTVLVEGFDPPLKLQVCTTFGRIMQLQADIAKTDDGDTQAQVDVMIGFFDDALRSWEGVFDDADQPVPYSRQAFLDLDVEDATAIMQAVQNIGEAGSGDPKVETPTTDTSGQPPAS